MNILNMLNTLPQVQAGRLRALAVTGLKRSPYLPSLPTLDESGLKGFEMVEFHSVAFPAGVPKPILARMHAEITKALRSDDVKQKFAQQTADVVVSTPEALGKYLLAEQDKFAKIVKAIGLKPE
jgi:tripartite-type tricarboxylate transporter receptor subunit TctC